MLKLFSTPGLEPVQPLACPSLQQCACRWGGPARHGAHPHPAAIRGAGQHHPGCRRQSHWHGLQQRPGHTSCA